MTNIDQIRHTIIIGISVYIALIFMLRISGKRTLSKWNSFDFIVTVAFGSTLATTLLDKQISLLESITAFAVLIGLQYVITFISVRTRFFERLIKARPTMLYSEGEFCRQNMRNQRISRSEIFSAIRNNGLASLDQVEAVILETDGSISVIKKAEDTIEFSALQDVDK